MTIRTADCAAAILMLCFGAALPALADDPPPAAPQKKTAQSNGDRQYRERFDVEVGFLGNTTSNSFRRGGRDSRSIPPL